MKDKTEADTTNDNADFDIIPHDSSFTDEFEDLYPYQQVQTTKKSRHMAVESDAEIPWRDNSDYFAFGASAPVKDSVSQDGDDARGHYTADSFPHFLASRKRPAPKTRTLFRPDPVPITNHAAEEKKPNEVTSCSIKQH